MLISYACAAGGKQATGENGVAREELSAESGSGRLSTQAEEPSEQIAASPRLAGQSLARMLEMK